MNDDRVKYYYALTEENLLKRHGHMLNDHAWEWMTNGKFKKRESIRFYSKEDYDKFIKDKKSE